MNRKVIVAGIQIGEKLEKVAQLLAVDPELVKQRGRGLDIDSGAALPHPHGVP